MRLAIVGSRECGSHIERTHEILAVLRGLQPAEVVTGGAWGIDSIAEKCAKALGIPVKVYPADWKTHGKRAGFLRNRTIVQNSDVVHAWWDGKSRGTQHSMNLADSTGKPLVVHRF